MNVIRPNGPKFDYSKIQQITGSMKEKLRQKYESLSSVQNESQIGGETTTTQSSVLDNYITDIETLFLDGVFEGDLRINGTLYVNRVEDASRRTDDVDRKIEAGPVRSFESTRQWATTKLEDVELWRCKFYNASFINETQFRDTVRAERDIAVSGVVRSTVVGFHAIGNGTSYPTAQITSRAYTTVITNLGASWNATTGYFTPKIAGYYYVSASAQLTQSSTTANSIVKNATQTSSQTLATVSTSGTAVVSTCTAFVYMNGTTDTLSTWTTSSIVISTTSYFNAYLVMAT